MVPLIMAFVSLPRIQLCYMGFRLWIGLDVHLLADQLQDFVHTLVVIVIHRAPKGSQLLHSSAQRLNIVPWLLPLQNLLGFYYFSGILVSTSINLRSYILWQYFSSSSYNQSRLSCSYKAHTTGLITLFGRKLPWGLSWPCSYHLQIKLQPFLPKPYLNNSFKCLLPNWAFHHLPGPAWGGL